mgnify:CR=1 FL=1
MTAASAAPAAARPEPPLDVLIVDDESLARLRLRSLLGDCIQPRARALAEAADAPGALALLKNQKFDVALLDIHLPGMSGVELARQLRELPDPPPFIFITAHAEHAVDAFELEATDYLTKPVRLERLQAALQKVARLHQARQAAAAAAAAASAGPWLLISERGRVQRVPLGEVIYFKAELKYLTVRTASATYLLDDSLNHIESEYPGRFLRIHRNALVRPDALRAIVRQRDSLDGDSWAVRLAGVDELLAISRRQVSAVREALGQS